jgi:hypothetical protein
MRRITLFSLPLLLWAAAGCTAVETPPPRPEVQVLLNDGQILVGQMTTLTFTLRTGMGTFTFDTAHAGELGPLEGDDIQKAERMIRLWLRNGSEFVGEWERPDVRVRLHLGGREIFVNVPIAKVKRLQFRGHAVWPDRPVFRILTRSGDDFFVDVTRTQMTFRNELGIFSPFLSEVTQLEPLDKEKKNWQIFLRGGMVFRAEIAQKELDLKLDMGPHRIRLPLDSVEVMQRQALRQPRGLALGDGMSGDFYSNESQRNVKEQAARSWKK